MKTMIMHTPESPCARKRCAACRPKGHVGPPPKVDTRPIKRVCRGRHCLGREVSTLHRGGSLPIHMPLGKYKIGGGW